MNDYTAFLAVHFSPQGAISLIRSVPICNSGVEEGECEGRSFPNSVNLFGNKSIEESLFVEKLISS